MTFLRKHGILLLAAAMFLVGASALVMSRTGGDSGEPENLALIDQPLTSEVQTEVARALVGVLSYDFADPARSQAAADEVLSGAARKEYDTLVASLHEQAPDQQLVLSAQVQASAVKELTATRAELLVFLDQTSQRIDDDEASISAAHLSVVASKVGGRWMITGLTPL